MTDLEKKINETFDLAVYLQLMGAFVPYSDWSKIKEIVLSTHEFLTSTKPEEIEPKLPELESTLTKMTKLFIDKFPLKTDISTIAKDWNDLFKQGKNVFSNGLDYGWLEKYMNLGELYSYNYIPFHFKIGLVAHKGFGSVEEEFLLKDSFNTLVKAEYYFDVLMSFGEKAKKEENLNNSFTKGTYTQITDLKYEVSAFSRLTIISFYSFIECFVNSIGYSFLNRNLDNLNENEREILSGLKKGRYLQLKSKIENFQKIIRPDNQAKIVISDYNQIKEPFKSFFDSYEEIRNSSVHYSPTKERIWLKPNDWLDKAKDFSKLSVKVGLEFWNACYPTLKEPDYLGRFDYDFLKDLAKERQNKILKIENELYKY